jgi:hypothetical protein
MKATWRFFKKGGVICHLALQTEPTKPAVGQIEMHRFAKPLLRAACAGAANRRRANNRDARI